MLADAAPGAAAEGSERALRLTLPSTRHALLSQPAARVHAKSWASLSHSEVRRFLTSSSCQLGPPSLRGLQHSTCTLLQPQQLASLVCGVRRLT